MTLRTFRTSLFAISLFAATAFSPAALAGEPRYYIEAIAGITNLSSQDAEVDIDAGEGDANLDFDSGFASGLAFGWEPSANWRFEGEYIYKTNGLSKATLPDGSEISEGDFSSVTLSANAYYLFDDVSGAGGGSLHPFIGAGLGWLQEVDIDFEEDGTELSWETSDVGFNAMAGLAWRPVERWSFEIEARYFSASSVEMEARNERVTADYDPITINFSAAYRF